MTILVNDTFAGGGLLSAHTGESGHGWHGHSYGYSWVADIYSVGSGVVARPPANLGGGATWTYGVIPTGAADMKDGYVEVTFQRIYDSNAAHSVELTLYLRMTDVWGANTGYQARAWFFGGAALGLIEIYDGNGGTVLASASIPNYSGAHTMRFSAIGTALSVSFDGVVKASGTETRGVSDGGTYSYLSGAGQYGFGSDDTGNLSSYILVDSFTAVTGDVVPTPFWTAKTGTTETY